VTSMTSIFSMPIRSDKAGDGHFMARRGTRYHKGIDLKCNPGTMIESPISGKITKIGYPYFGDTHYRYVEIEDNHSYVFRFFYVENIPNVELGYFVKEGELFAIVQDISSRYPDDSKPMQNHIHLEMYSKERIKDYIDPTPFYHLGRENYLKWNK